MSSNRASFGLYRPFTGAIRVRDTDPLFDQITEGRVVRVSYRGRWLDAFRVETVSVETSDAGLVKEASGRGGLAYLDDAIVWYDAANPQTEREISGTYAGILLTLIGEAQARGVFGVTITPTFTADTDSAGNAIGGGTVSMRLQVGSTLLDYIRAMWERGIWIRARWSFETSEILLDWYEPPYGRDLTDAVRIRLQQASQHRRQVDATYLTTALLVKNGDAFLEVRDDAAAGTYGRRERLLSLDNAGSNAEAQALAADVLAQDTAPRQAITLEVEDLDDGPRVFIDYDLGDIISVHMPDTEQWENWRIVGLTLDFQDHGRARVGLELNHEPPDYELAQARLVQRASIGRHSEVAHRGDPEERQRAHEADSLAHRNLQIGDAGGDVTGTATSVTVVGIRGRPVADIAPTAGQVLAWNGSAWAPADQSSGGGGGGGGGVSSVLDSWLLGRTIVPPRLSDGWQWFYQDAATVTEVPHGLHLYHPGATADRLCGMYVPYPSPPFTVYMAYVHNAVANVNYIGAGLIVLDDTNRAEYIRWAMESSYIQVQRFTDPTSYNSTQASIPLNAPGWPVMWFRLHDDGTNREWAFSLTGHVFITAYQTSRTDFISPTRIGFFINPHDGGRPIAYTVVHWEIV